MFTNIIQHPADEFFVIVRPAYIKITGDACAAELLAIFEFLTTPIVNLAQEERWIRKRISDLKELLMHRYSRDLICRGLRILDGLKLIKREKTYRLRDDIHPYTQDVEYLFEVESVQAAINQVYAEPESVAPVDTETTATAISENTPNADVSTFVEFSTMEGRDDDHDHLSKKIDLETTTAGVFSSEKIQPECVEAFLESDVQSDQPFQDKKVIYRDDDSAAPIPPQILKILDQVSEHLGKSVYDAIRLQLRRQKSPEKVLQIVDNAVLSFLERSDVGIPPAFLRSAILGEFLPKKKLKPVAADNQNREDEKLFLRWFDSVLVQGRLPKRRINDTTHKWEIEVGGYGNYVPWRQAAAQPLETFPLSNQAYSPTMSVADVALQQHIEETKQQQK